MVHRPLPALAGDQGLLGRRGAARAAAEALPCLQQALPSEAIVCTDCGSDALARKRASGRGEVYSFSEVHRAPGPAFAKGTPYVVGLVRLEEGVHLFTRFVDGPVEIGTKVRVDFRKLELGNLMPIFRVEGA